MSTRPITDTMRHIGGGVFIDTASDKLAELVPELSRSYLQQLLGLGYAAGH